MHSINVQRIAKIELGYANSEDTKYLFNLECVVVHLRPLFIFIMIISYWSPYLFFRKKFLVLLASYSIIQSALFHTHDKSYLLFVKLTSIFLDYISDYN